MREPNAVDFWRGFALVTIFINHIPGNFFERFTYSGYFLSDAAELFVFLAGWSLALATESKGVPEPPTRVILRLSYRTIEVYRAQLVIAVLALAIISGAALYLDNPLLLEWHNAGLFYSDPVQASVGFVLLSYQLGYFNILPLYVALLAIAPVFILLARFRRWLAFALSAMIYLTALTLELNLPNWPGEGDWFFNPLAWQFLFVSGFLSSVWARESETFRSWAKRLLPLALLGVLPGIAISLWDLKPDPFNVPEPRLLFLFDKSNLSPARMFDFTMVVLAFYQMYPWIQYRLPGLTSFLSALGRNSLSVFAVGSILDLVAQLIRSAEPRSFVLDTCLVGAGMLGLWFTAWFAEWRSRSPRSSLSR
ncbi:OpgC family protein [Microvirga massiliensis]|uniref:OpgC family protein n=1 Tax=Microvirga massiliensis TaxID=1033741 RepID=UPI00062B9271|nr:OpgC domain-containing protein [Microvirga massiliensis]